MWNIQGSIHKIIPDLYPGFSRLFLCICVYIYIYIYTSIHNIHIRIIRQSAIDSFSFDFWDNNSRLVSCSYILVTLTKFFSHFQRVQANWKTGTRKERKKETTKETFTSVSLLFLIFSGRDFSTCLGVVIIAEVCILLSADWVCQDFLWFFFLFLTIIFK